MDHHKKKPGRLVQHEDGRVGIIYNDSPTHQTPLYTKFTVHFIWGSMAHLRNNVRLEKPYATIVNAKYLTVKGYVD